MEAIKRLMNKHHTTLTELNTTFCQENGEPLFSNLEQLKQGIENCSIDENSISYDTAPIHIRNHEIMGHTIPNATEKLDHIDIGISLKNITIRLVEDHIEDPITTLEGFDIILKTQQNAPDYFVASWHLDKRIKSERYSYLEPEYHFTFGGKHMEALYAKNWGFGSALIMRAPRLMHPPMDIILGIDFILNQFIPIEYSDIFLNDQNYIKTVNQMKLYLWKPYALGLAKNFFSSVNDLGGITYDEHFCKNILGSN